MNSSYQNTIHTKKANKKSGFMFVGEWVRELEGYFMHVCLSYMGFMCLYIC
jgi:hypothetical protein